MLTAPDQKNDVDEKRTATRHTAAAMSSITGIRLSPIGTEAHLVNISTTGILVRCATRLMPGTAVTVLFEGTFAPPPVKGTVVRCLVADICRPAGLSYHVGIHFKEPIAIDDAQVEDTTPATKPADPPTEQVILVNRW
jgi:hypothetical protein